MNREKNITIKNLIYALLFLVLGILLLTSTEDIISIVSKVIGGILVITGLVQSIIYIYNKGKLGEYSIKQLIVGLLIIGCGCLLIFSANILSFAIKVTIGLWILFSAINRMVLAISIRSLDKAGFKMYLLSSVIMLIVGILLISGMFDKLIGLFIIIYAIFEIVDYIYYVLKHKDTVVDSKVRNEKVSEKRIKNTKVVDAVIEENTSKEEE